MDLIENKGDVNSNNSDLQQSQNQPEVISAAESAPEVIASNSSKIQLISISDRGFTNGVLGLSPEPFVEWLEASEQLSFHESQLFENQKKLFGAEEKLANAIASWKGYYQETTQELDKIAENEQKQFYLEEKISIEEQEKEEKKTKLGQLITLYSWVPAILLCLAGVVFIGADVGITHDIVVNALNQPNGVESWLFAFALAFIAFVFKPAFDRILEKNYQDEQVRKRNHIFLMVVCGFAIITLFIMGVFRGNTDAERNQLRDLRAEKSDLQDKIELAESDAEAVQWTQGIDAKNKEIKSKQDNIINNDFRLWIFVLSSILFAVSGTICVSIGMASCEVLLKKHKLNKAIAVAGKLIDSLKVELKEVGSFLRISRNAIEKLEKQIALDPELDAIRQQIHLYETSIAANKQNVLDQSVRKDKARYTDAYARGEKYLLDGALTIKMSELEAKTENGRAGSENSGERKSQAKSGGSRRRRPFVMLRRIIADQYSKSGHPSTMDTEIEVSDVI